MRLERMGLEKTRVGLSAARKIVELPWESKFKQGTPTAIISIPDLRPGEHSKLVKGIWRNYAESSVLEEIERHTIII